jgi:NAD(P)H dehydrogenase (quinone)
LPQVLASGQWFTSAGEGRLADVSRGDTARAAVAALLASDGGSHAYDISGPQALTTDEVAALVSEVTGKPIQVVQISKDAQVQALKGAGLPGFVVDIVVGFDQNTLQGRAANVSGDFQKLTGREPQRLKDFLVANKAKLAG